MEVVDSRHSANVKQESEPGSQGILQYEQHTGDLLVLSPHSKMKLKR